MTEKKDNLENIKWETNISIFRHPFILKQLGIAIGIPFGLLIIGLIIIIQEIRYLTYALLLIGMTFLVTYITIKILYHGKYKVKYIIDGKGIRCYTEKNQKRKNTLVNSLVVIFGIFSGKYSVSGAGMLAQSKQDLKINWKNIKKVSYHPKQQFIILSKNFAERMAVFCTKENYDKVSSVISNNTK